MAQHQPNPHSSQAREDIADWAHAAHILHQLIGSLPSRLPQASYRSPDGYIYSQPVHYHGVDSEVLRAQLAETRAHIDSIVMAANRMVDEADELHTPAPARVQYEAAAIDASTLVLRYTSHGYPYPTDSGESEEKPDLLARCGGPALCTPCAREAGWGQLDMEHYEAPSAQQLAAMRAVADQEG